MRRGTDESSIESMAEAAELDLWDIKIEKFFFY